MAKPRILLTRKWPKQVEQHLAKRYDVTGNPSDQPMDSTQLKAALRSFDAVLPTVTDKLDDAVFDQGNMQVKILANYGVGFAHIDSDAAKNNNIVVTNTPEILSECTADIAMTLMLMVARRAGEGERQLRAGAWQGWHPTHMIGSKVSGKTLGIIGFGRIGQEMARRAHFGFGMKILVQNRSTIDPEILSEYGATQLESVDDFLPLCDFVSLHCPGGSANRHLINRQRLDLMKPTAFLINTARGEVIDDSALAKALKQKDIAGAGLDVFEREPDINQDLAGIENLVMLPHLGSSTAETRIGMGLRVADNLDAFFDGCEPKDRVV